MLEINSQTRLSELLKEYPWLKNELANISPKFKMLKTPIAKIMMKKADINEMSKKAGIDADELIDEINMLIKNNET